MHKLQRLFLYSLAIFPLLDLLTTNIVVLLFVFSGILSLKYKIGSRKKITVKRLTFVIFFLSMPFWLFLFSLFLYDNFSGNLSFLERSLLFIIIPLVLFLGNPFKDSGQIRVFLRIYIFSCFILSLIILLSIGYDAFKSGPLSDLTNYSLIIYLRTQIDNILFFNEHPIYISLLLGTSLIFLFFNKFQSRLLNVTLTVPIMALLLLASSRGVLIGLTLVFSGMVIDNFNNKLRGIGYILVFLLIGGMTIYFSPLRSRIQEISETTHFYPQGRHYNSFNLRMGIYNCAYEIVLSTPIIGYGPGNVQKKLDQCFLENYDTDAYQKGIYNTHNQFMFYIIAFGLIGIVLIIGSYIVFIRRALIMKDKLYLYFLIFMLISFLTENVLSRNTGIMLFSIYNSLFFYKYYLVNDNS